VSARGPLSAERLAQIRETQLGDWYSGEWVQDYVESDGEEPAHYVVTERESNTVLAMLPDWAGPIALWMADAHEAVPELLAEVERLRVMYRVSSERESDLIDERDELGARVAELEQHTSTRAAAYRQAADDLDAAFGDPAAKHIGALGAAFLRRRAREITAEGGGPA
jgi:hypothetical protein